MSFFNTILAGLLQFASITVLARLLTPAQYGVYALCTAIASLSATFVISVMERTLVVTAANDGERDEFLVIALLCVSASVGALLICVALNHGGISHVDIGVLLVMCGSSVVSAAAISPRVALRRHIRFGPIIVAETAGLLAGQGGVAIVLAAAGWGAYALAVGACVQSLVIALVLRSRFRRLTIVPPTSRHVARMVRSASSIAGVAGIEIANAQVAPLVLGGRLGDVALGLFNRSYSLVQMPIQLLVTSMSRVMISALLSLSDDQVRLRSASRSLTRVASVVAAPVAAGIAGASHNFVVFAFGAKWLGAEPILPWLALAGWATMMGTLFGVIVEAMRAFGSKARTQTIATIVLMGLALGGASFGLLGAVMGIAVACCVFLLLFARLASRLLGLPMREPLSWLVPGMIVALPCFAVSLLIGRLMPDHAATVFPAQIVACGIVDGIALLLLFPSLGLQIIEGVAPAALRLTGPVTPLLRRAAERGCWFC